MRPDRIGDRCIPEPNSGCLLWLGPLNSWGYGRVRVGSSLVYIHRLAWEVAHGPVPDGLCVLHHCDVPSCVNTDHLFLGTHADNGADKARKWRGIKGAMPFGVRVDRNGKYVARATVAPGTRRDVGRYRSLDLAATMAVVAKLEALP